MSSSSLTSDFGPPTSAGNDNEVLVKVEGVSKKFCRDLKKSLWYGVKDVAAELLPFGRQRTEIRDQRSEIGSQRSNPSGLSSSSLTSDLRPLTSAPSLRDGEFWAVSDVSFELRRGECLGLIGRNGAGKTTLLKMLNGLIKPDAGRIEMRGRVGALIALGAGFNPILSGRENIYVNGSILGLSKKEIDAKIDEIIDFAEIGEFIDAPVQSYSSGMQVRLGFAVATAMEPDVLILDEVLAVGDVNFRAKCYNKISEVLNQTACIIVSHSESDIRRVSTSGLLLEKGKTQLSKSDIDSVYNCYYINSKAKEQFDILENKNTSCENILKIIELSFPENIKWNEFAHFKAIFDNNILLKRVGIRLSIMNGSEKCVAEWSSVDSFGLKDYNAGINQCEFKLGPINLCKGLYLINIVFFSDNIPYLKLVYKSLEFRVDGPSQIFSEYRIA